MPQHSQDSPQGCSIGLGLTMEEMLEVVEGIVLRKMLEKFSRRYKVCVQRCIDESKYWVLIEVMVVSLED
jgi:hypothetical protein